MYGKTGAPQKKTHKSDTATRIISSSTLLGTITGFDHPWGHNSELLEGCGCTDELFRLPGLLEFFDQTD